MKRKFRNKTGSRLILQINGKIMKIPVNKIVEIDVNEGLNYPKALQLIEDKVPAAKPAVVKPIVKVEEPKKELLVDSPPDSPPLEEVKEEESKSEDEEEINTDDLTKNEIKKLLDDKQIEYPTNATKAMLVELLK